MEAQQQQEQKPFEKKQPTFVPLSELRPRQNCKNVYVYVVSSQITTEERDGEQVKLAQGYVSDDSAYLRFSVRGKFADLLKEKSYVAFRNLKSIYQQGEHAITVDQWGKISEETKESTNIQQPLTYFKTIKLQDFVPGENNFNLNVKIQEITETKERENKRPAQEGEEKQEKYIYQVSGVAGDHTAIINFIVKGKNAHRVKVGQAYTFINSLSSVIEETHTLVSGDRGHIKEYEQNITIPEQAKNLSSQKYEKVIVGQEENNRPQRKQSGDRNRNRNTNNRNNNNNNNRDNRRNNSRSRNNNNNRNNDNYRGNRNNNNNNNRDNRRNNNNQNQN